MNSIINSLKNKKLVWQAKHTELIASTNSTGFHALDEQLQGGFPQQGIVEIESPIGIGELRLLLPDLLTRQKSSDKLLVFIAPPIQLNSEMWAESGFDLSRILIVKPKSLSEALWCAEQCLASGCCYALLMWHQRLDISHVRRMQLASQKGEAIQFIFHTQQPLQRSLPVSLAMQFSAHPQGISIEIKKRKGGWPKAKLPVNMQKIWPELTQTTSAKNVIPFPTKHSWAS